MILLRAFATFWDFFNYIFGTNILQMPPNTYGMMMAIAFGVGVWIGYRELKRRTALGIFQPGTKETTIGDKPKISALITPFIFGFFIGLKAGGYFTDYANFSANPQLYFLSLKGNMLWAVVLGSIWAGYEYYSLKKKMLPQPKTIIIQHNVEDRIFDILILAVIGGILGSKLLDAIDNPASMAELLTNPIQSLTSGLSVLGGLWLAALLIMLYGRKYKINLMALTDSLAPAFFMAYAVGRLGCQFAGDGCWGIVSEGYTKPWFVPDFLWGNTYAHNVNNEGILIPGCMGNFCSVLPQPHFPTPLYEFIMVSLLFILLWAIRKKLTNSLGAITGIFMIMNGLERFLIEFIRVNTKYSILGLNLSQAQYISLAMILIGAGLTIWAIKKNKFIQKNNSNNIQINKIYND